MNRKTVIWLAGASVCASLLLGASLSLANKAVEVNAATGSYTKVTDVSQLVAGDKIVFAYGSSAAMTGTLSKDYITSGAATVSGSTLTSSAADSFTLGGSSSGWTFKSDATGSLLGSNGNKKLYNNGTGVTTWTISISSGTTTVTSTTAANGSIQYNTSSPRFTTYTTTQGAISLYRQASVTISELTVTPNTWSGNAGDTLAASSFSIGGTRSTGTISSNDYKIAIGTGSGSTFVKRADFSFGTTPVADGDETIKITSVYPTASGATTYASCEIALTVASAYATGLTASPLSGYYYGDIIPSLDVFDIKANLNGGEKATYSNVSLEIGSGTSSTDFVKRADYVVGTTPTVTGDTLMKITANDPTTSGGDTYESVYVALNLTEYIPSGYLKITENLTDWSGTYLLGYEKSTTEVYLWNGVDDSKAYTSVTQDNGEITGSLATDELVITINKMYDSSKVFQGYSISPKSGDFAGKYITEKSTSANGFSSSDTPIAHKISFNGSYLEIRRASSGSSARYLCFNTATDQLRFRFMSGKYSTTTLYRLAWTEEERAEAKAFAKSFNESSICGSDDYTESSLAIWNSELDAYGALSRNAKALLANRDVASDADIASFYAKYDMILAKAQIRGSAANYYDFLAGKATVQAAGSIFAIKESGDSMLIIALVSLVSFAAVGTLLVYKRRK